MSHGGITAGDYGEELVRLAGEHERSSEMTTSIPTSPPFPPPSSNPPPISPVMMSGPSTCRGPEDAAVRV